MADEKRSIELLLKNKSNEDFIVFDYFLDPDTSKWIDGEEPVVGKTVAKGTSVTWGVVALNPGQVPWGEVRLASPAKTGIAFKFETHTNTFTSLMVQLSPKINYQVLPTTVDQPQVKTQVVITSS